nr:alpha/beta hydrolase [Nocardia brevicatena]
MPGSRVDTAPPELLEALGIRLITFDRPGYGGSEYYDMKFTDAAEHVKAIADHFEIEKFAIVGRSGGTPYAAAAAAGLPDQVTKLGLLVPFAPPEVMKARFRANMSQQDDTDLSFEELSTKRLASFQDSNDPLAIIGISRNDLSDKNLAIIEKITDFSKKCMAKVCGTVRQAGTAICIGYWASSLGSSMSVTSSARL